MASNKERLASKNAAIMDDDEPAALPSARPEPRTAPGQMMQLQGKYAHVLDENLRLQQLISEAAPSELLITDLHEVPGRRRTLTSEQFRELSNNLKHNPLVTPITVRKLARGAYEIVSGHNRVQAFKDLGRERILAAVIESDENQADLSAFYANLLQPDLPDFEKFVGFTEIVSRSPNLTRAEIAANAGVDPSTISQLMSFGGLPNEAIAILRERPEILGANAAQDFAKLSAKGRGAQVVEAIRKIAAGQLDQARAVKFAASDLNAAPRTKTGEPLRIKSGKTVYCDLLRADKVLRIVFKSAEEAQAAQEAIREILEHRALQGK